jgi:hypothetical protein
MAMSQVTAHVYHNWDTWSFFVVWHLILINNVLTRDTLIYLTRVT